MWLDIRRPQGKVSSSSALDFVARINLSGDQTLTVTTIGYHANLPHRLESLTSLTERFDIYRSDDIYYSG